MKKQKILLLFCLLFGLIALTGCGIEISTDMAINQQFEGTRTISCYVSKQDMSLHFKGDSTKIDTIINNNCPGSLEYTKNETNSGTEYIFQLNFSSLDDYKTQLSSILNFSPQVNYKGVDSLFSQSVELEENFTSIDLLRWFEILLTEEYSITEKQLGSLWNIQDTTVTWMDQAYRSETDAIKISSHSLSPFDGISIYTEEKEDRTFVRKIQFAIPKETLDKRWIELEESFENIKPEETTGIWQTTDTGKNYELTFQADDFKSLSEKTAKALNTSFGKAKANASFSDYQYLTLLLEYSETLDFSCFLSSENGDVSVNYYFKPNTMTEIDSNRLQREVNNAFIPKLYDNGYYKIFSGSCSSLNISTFGKMSIPVTGYSLTTTVKSNDQLKREFQFSLKNVLKSEEYEALSSVLKANSNDILSLKVKESDSAYTLFIMQTGSPNQINDSSELIFGDGNSIVFKEQGFLQYFSNQKLIEFQDTIHLSNFLGTISDEITGKYILRDLISSKQKEMYASTSSGERIEFDITSKNDPFIDLNDSIFTVYYTGSTPSTFGILIFIVLILILIGSILFFIKKNPMKKQKTDPI